jgi:hypothetical protein
MTQSARLAIVTRKVAIGSGDTNQTFSRNMELVDDHIPSSPRRTGVRIRSESRRASASCSPWASNVFLAYLNAP